MEIIEFQSDRAHQVDAPTFDRTADATLERVRATYGGRGMTYGDAWALPNQKAALTEFVLNLPRHDYRAWLRLLQLAVLCDVKDSRLVGGGNIDDHLIDHLAYKASFTEHLREYEGR